MALVKWIAVLLFGVFAGCCNGDVVADAGQVSQQLDAAIKASEDAWVTGAAQTQVLKTVLTFSDPKAQETQDAQALENSYEGQLATYNSTLNDLYAERAAMGSVLTAYQEGIAQKINDYKTVYVGQMDSITAQLKLVENSIITIQNLLADPAMTDAKNLTISDTQGKAQGALSGVGDTLNSLRSLDAKIDSDFAGLKQQDAAQAKAFYGWWMEQKAWVKQTQAAVDERMQYLSKLGASNVLTASQQGVAQKINDYKTAYVGKMGEITAQLKLVEDVIITIQNLLADPAMTDAKKLTISDTQGKAQGALSGVGDALNSLSSLDAKIDSDFAGLKQQDAAQANAFYDWWMQQKAWVKQTQAAVDERMQYLSQLGAQNALTTSQLGMAQKINDYKAAYVGKMGSITAQLKLVEDSIIAIQNILADPAMTDTKTVTISDTQGKAQGALSGVGDALNGLSSLDAKIDSDFAGFKQQDAAQAKAFYGWWMEQKAWATQTQAAVDARKQYLSQLGDQMAQKQKDFNATQVIQKQLDASAADLQQKKLDALSLFQQLVQVRATLIQDMSDLANTIASTLGSADQALAAATQDTALAAILDAAQSITNNMMAMGGLKSSFTSSEDVTAQALASLKAFFSDQELVSLQSSIAQQSSWVQNFSSALQAMRDQSSAIRTKLDIKRTQLAAATAPTANQSAADYAASVQQVTQIIVQVHNEAASLIKDVMTPLVLSVSQNMMAVMGYFDLQATTSSDLMSMKNLIDEISSDVTEMDTLLNEFNLWSTTFNQYGDLIQQQVADAALRQTLSVIKQDFTSWGPWITAVSGRQARMKQSIVSAQTKYNVLAAQLNASASAVASASSAVQTNVPSPASLSLATTPSIVTNSTSNVVAPVADALALTTTVTTAGGAAVPDVIASLSLTTTPSIVGDAATTSLATSLSLTTTPTVVPAVATTMTLTTTVSGDTATAVANGLLGAPAVTALVENVKKVTDSTAALKAMTTGFKARLDSTKITDDFTQLNTDFTAAQGQVDPLNGMIARCLADADAAQKLMDQDTAAGRNVASDVVQSLADQRTALAAAQQDMGAVAKGLSDVTSEFNGLVANFAQKATALSGVNAAAIDLANKIQAISGYLSTIKQAIQGAQSALANAKTGADCDVALASLTNAQQLKVTIVNAKANEAMPSKQALGARVIAFTQAYGAVPDALGASITSQGAWLDALDVSLDGYMSSVASLQAQLMTLRGSLAQSDMQSLASMTFSAQLQALENAVPAISQLAQVDTIMRNLDYAVTNRYGSLPGDQNPDTIVANKARLLRFIDWVTRNNRFASKVSALAAYRRQITG